MVDEAICSQNAMGTTLVRTWSYLATLFEDGGHPTTLLVTE